MSNKASHPAQTRDTQPDHKTARPAPQPSRAPAESQPGEALQRAALDPAALSPQEVIALQRGAGNRAVAALLKPASHVLPIQKKLVVGAADDAYEREADRISEQVVSADLTAPAGAPGHLAGSQAQRQEEEEEVQAKPLAATITPLIIHRQVEEEEPLQSKRLQRQEEEEVLQSKRLQRVEEEEPLQGKRLQREAEEEEPLQGKRLQRQEEEEPLQEKRLQRDTEEEEPLQGKLLQRETEEEEPLQGKRLQRETEEEEPLQEKRLQREVEEEEPLQGKRLQREIEEEEPLQGKRLQREVEEEEPLQGKRLQRETEEEEPLQGKRLQRESEEEEPLQGKRLQRVEEEEPLQGKRAVQRQEEEEDLQTARKDPLGSFDAGPAVESRLEAASGGGHPMPGPLREYMEPRFGVDFSEIRLHTDGQAAELNRAIHAQAFTHGNDIYLGEGRYDPDSTSGRQLLAHELTHTIQQTGGVQRLTNKASVFKTVDEGKTFFGGLTSWGELVKALADYEAAANSSDAARLQEAALQRILKASESWLSSTSRKTLKPKDEQKRALIESLRKEALREASHTREEAEFSSTFKKEAYANPEKARETGEQLVKSASKHASSHKVKAIESATKEMYASENIRVREVYAILSALNARQIEPHHESFEKVQGLLTGGAGMGKAYAEFKRAVTKNSNLGDDALDLDLNIFYNWKRSPRPSYAVEYLQGIAHTGQIDPKWSILLNLGQIDGDRVNGEYVRDQVEQYFSADLMTRAPTDPAAVKTQAEELRSRLNAFQGFCHSHSIAAPGDDRWRKTSPWKDVAIFAGDILDRIESAMKYADAVAKAGEKVAGGEILVEDTKQPEKKPTAEAAKARDELVETTIGRLLTYMQAVRGTVYTSSAEAQQMLDYASQWKRETLNLEKKFGLPVNFIGQKIIDEQRIGAWKGKGLGRDQLSHLLDIVSGKTGMVYQTIAKYKQKETVTPESESGKQVSSVIDQHTERQTIITAGDIDALADDLVRIGQSDPKALLAYMLELRGTKYASFKATPADFEPNSTTFTPEERDEVIQEAFDELKKKLEIRELAQEKVQLRREKRAALEKIIAIFKFGPNVMKEGQGYIAVRQALTERVYRSKSLLQLMDKITDKDRAMIRSDAGLRAQLSAALTDDPEDRKKIVGILGFDLLDTTGRTPGAAEFVGGVNAATGAGLDVKAVTAPQKDGKLDYSAVIHQWAAAFENNYHTFAQDVALVGALKSTGQGLLTIATLGMNKIVQKSKPDTKAMLVTAYRTQNALRAAVESDPSKPANPDYLVQNQIKLMNDPKILPDVGKIKDLDPTLRSYFEKGEFISMDRLMDLGMGTIAADKAFLLEIVKNASAEDLIQNFSDIEKYYQVFGQFEQQVQAIQKGGPDDEIQERFARLKDLQALLLAYTPGVKISFVKRLEDSKRVRADTRRVVVEEIQGRLANAYESDPRFREKMDQVRRQVAELDQRESARVKTGKEGTETTVSLGGLKLGLTGTESRASSEQIQEQTRMQNTRALRGLSLRRGYIIGSGLKAGLMESRAEYLGSGRSMIGSRATGSEKRAEQKGTLDEAEADLRAKELKLSYARDALRLAREIIARGAELSQLRVEKKATNQTYKEKYAVYNVAQEGEEKDKLSAELWGLHDKGEKLDKDIQSADKQIQTLESRITGLMKIVNAGVPSVDQATPPTIPGLEAKVYDLTQAVESARKTADQARTNQQGSTATSEMELTKAVSETASARQDYDKKVAAFLAYREKVKTAVSIIIQLLITAIVIGATLGQGALAAIPFWVGIIVSAVSRAIEEIVEAAFDPERMTLLEGAYEIITTAIVSAITGTVGMGLDAIPVHLLSVMKAPEQILGFATSPWNLLDTAVQTGYQQAIKQTIGLLAGQIQDGVRVSLMTGDSRSDIENKFSAAAKLPAYSTILTSALNAKFFAPSTTT